MYRAIQALALLLSILLIVTISDASIPKPVNITISGLIVFLLLINSVMDRNGKE